MELSINYMSANFCYTIVNCKNTFFLQISKNVHPMFKYTSIYRIDI